jgi:hypothetical protein
MKKSDVRRLEFSEQARNCFLKVSGGLCAFDRWPMARKCILPISSKFLWLIKLFIQSLQHTLKDFLLGSWSQLWGICHNGSFLVLTTP